MAFISTELSKPRDQVARPSVPAKPGQWVRALEHRGFRFGSVSAPGPALGPELAVIIPTFNERDNVALVLERLERCLGDAPPGK